MLDAHFIWDLPDDPNGNVQHIAEHGFTQEDVESVFFSAGSTAASRSSGQEITFGYTTSGQYLAVVWELVSNDPLTIRPITAFKVREPRLKKRRRNKRRGT